MILLDLRSPLHVTPAAGRRLNAIIASNYDIPKKRRGGISAVTPLPLFTFISCRLIIPVSHSACTNAAELAFGSDGSAKSDRC